MSARLLDGPAVAAAIRETVLPDVAAFTASAGRPPGLGIVLVGNDPSSEIYVRNKVKAGAETGLWVDLQRLPATATLDELLALVARLNASDAHDGILVQSPLPAAMGDGRGAARVRRDRSGQGRRRLPPGQRRPARAGAAAPRAVHAVGRDRDARPLAASRSRGTRAVVIGRSEIVGKPMAMLLLQRDATVTICHSKTPDLPAVAREADILVAAIGRAGFVTPAFVKPGATVIDVGINRVTDAARVRDAVRAGLAAAGRLRAARLRRRRRRAPGGRRRRRRAHAGAWRRRSADDRDAAQEHRRRPRRRASPPRDACCGPR